MPVLTFVKSGMDERRMALREEDVSSVIASLYGSVVDPAQWSSAICGVRDILGGEGSVAFRMDAAGQRILSWRSVGIEPDGSEYGRRLHTINPRAHVSNAEPPGTVIWDYRCIEETAMDGHEFYAGIERLSGVRYFIGVRYKLDNGEALFTSVERTRKRGHVEASDIAVYNQIAPHIRNALEISIRLAPEQRKSGLFGLLDGKPGEAILLLSGTGCVVEMNDAAAQIISQGDGITLEDERLKTWKAADTRKMNALLGEVFATDIGAAVGHGGVIALARPSGALSYLLRVVPWPVAANGDEAEVATAVFIVDPQDKGRAARDDFVACFGLSPREADLVGLLGTGKSLPEAAIHMSVSHNTARIHLRHIFEKTGVSNQADLLRLLLALP